MEEVNFEDSKLGLGFRELGWSCGFVIYLVVGGFQILRVGYIVRGQDVYYVEEVAVGEDVR